MQMVSSPVKATIATTPADPGKTNSLPKKLTIPSSHGNIFVPEPSNDPSQVPVTLQMPPIVMLKIYHHLVDINPLGIHEQVYEEDSSKAERLHLACLLRAFSLRQCILGATSATLGALLRGLNLFPGMDDLGLQIPSSYLGQITCLPRQWAKVSLLIWLLHHQANCMVGHFTA